MTMDTAAPEASVTTKTMNSAVCTVTDGETILATADVAMPPECVFRALTTDEVEHWWGSADTYRVTKWTADRRVGGRWSLIVRRPDGATFPASGKFIEIDEPRKIVQTRTYEWEHPTLGRGETKVTYFLHPIEIGTRVTVRHDGFAGISEAAHEHAAGWKRFLVWLEAYMRPDFVSTIVAQFKAGLEDPARPFGVLARFQVKDGTQEKFEAAFAEARIATHKENGVIAYDLNRDADDATRYVVYERWKSLVDLETHLRTSYITALIAATNEVVAGAPEFRVLIPTAE